ncbi:MAG TPA: NUDIX hydrolase [Deinococcales bacterium]|nr:NUDIX hydrolase [Deinococcales bacterium]
MSVPPREPDSGERPLLFEGSILNVEQMPGGWEKVAKAAAVCVLAVRDGLVLGVEQPRPVVGATTWELPAGMIDPGETALEAAERELAEETQLGGRLSVLAEFYSSPGFTDEHTTVFRATHLEPVAGTPDPTEQITVSWRPLPELLRGLGTGELVTSASTAVGLALAASLNDEQ